MPELTRTLASVPELAALLAPRLPDILDLATRLTEVESGSLLPTGVDRVSDLVAERLAALGFTSRRHTIASGRGRAFEATLETGSPGLRLLVLGHADTVWPEGATADWPIVTNAPTMSGPGLGDMKCALAMAVHAIEAALETVVPGVASITYALVPDEELGSVDSRGWLADLGRRTDVCLALEAGLVDGGVIVSRGAVGAMIITAHGRTAHCTDDTGASALRALAPLVEELESLTDRAQRTICSVGILRSGTARQVVPDHAELHVDLRAPGDAAGRALVAEIRRRAEARAVWTGSGSRSPEESPVQRFRVRSPTRLRARRGAGRRRRVGVASRRRDGRLGRQSGRRVRAIGVGRARAHRVRPVQPCRDGGAGLRRPTHGVAGGTHRPRGSARRAPAERKGPSMTLEAPHIFMVLQI
ncbi:M20/M25/M40 family metallo-hydrolase [Rhodococcus hoagii]|nr:M20/M25/M40 family metallo-hydrolase [Prescottella equi]